MMSAGNTSASGAVAMQVDLLNFVLAGWTGKGMRLRKHHLGQAANDHLELALLKSLLGAEQREPRDSDCSAWGWCSRRPRPAPSGPYRVSAELG